MRKTWVLTAESSRARIFAVENRIRPLQELEGLTNPDGRAKGLDIYSDRPGRTFDSGGPGRHAMSAPMDPKQQETINFAKRIGERLERARTSGEFDELVLIAAPEFLGILRQHLSSHTMKLVNKTINKNLVQESEAIIREQLYG